MNLLKFENIEISSEKLIDSLRSKVWNKKKELEKLESRNDKTIQKIIELDDIIESIDSLSEDLTSNDIL